MSEMLSLAIALGACLGLGLWCVACTLPRVGSARLTARVAPFVADVSPAAFQVTTRVTVDPASVRARAAAMVVRRFPFARDGLTGNRLEVRRWLNQAGGYESIEAFRARQILWALGGLAVGVLADVVVAFFGMTTVVGLAAVLLSGLVTGYFAAELALRRTVNRRAARITSEIPTVFEFTSLCLAAGESITDALRRVSHVGSGEFAGELAHVTRQVDTGVPLTTALAELVQRLQIPGVTRAVEQILGALDRGSPLAAVLQAQAQDSREDSKRELLEKAGQKEVVMLVPLVFMILPVTILFAVFPGLLVVQAGFTV